MDTPDFSHTTACPDCDLLMPTVWAMPGYTIRCKRCDARLHKTTANSVEKTLAASLAGLLLYFPAILLPLLTLRTLGFSDSSNVIDSIVEFFNRGYFVVALAVLCAAVLFPFIKLLLLFFISLCIRVNRIPSALAKLFRLYNHLDEWGMIEVYLLGIMVTIVKMYHTADISYLPGFFCFIGLVIVTVGSSAFLDAPLFWSLLDPSSHGRQPQTTPPQHRSARTAAQAGLIACHDCRKLHPVPPQNSTTHARCSRCGARLHQRKPTSLSRTWALVLASIILLFPANLLPIMRVDFLGIADNSTILDGIIYFFEDGSYGIGLIILTASILIPLFKVSGLLVLLLTIHFRQKRFLRQQTSMFRLIQFIGRWSMLDIFVIALLAVLVNFGFFTSIHTAPAATYFCLVVIATMFAALFFDPRILWDRCDP